MEYRNRRKVRFSERANSILVFDSLPGNEHSPAGTSSSSGCGEAHDQQQPAVHLQQSRVDPRKRARDDASRLMPKGYGDLLAGSFKDPTENCQNNINAFVLDVPDAEHARGLERYLSPQHKDERDGAREDVVEAVLTRQRQMNRPRRRNSIGGPICVEERIEKLRDASRRHSRPSRIFARRLGIADRLGVDDLDDYDDEGEAEKCGEEEETAHFGASLPINPYLQGLGSSSPNSALTNAKMVSRQASVRELNMGIRSKAAVMNAKKACRQHSIRQLNVSIRNLASTLNGAGNVNNSSTTNADGIMHPSLMPQHHLNYNTNRDRALNIPGRPSRSQRPSSDCAQLIQSALDLVDSEQDPDLGHRSVVLSA